MLAANLVMVAAATVLVEVVATMSGAELVGLAWEKIAATAPAVLMKFEATMEAEAEVGRISP